MEEKYWQQFMATGSIADYLHYCREKDGAEEELLPQGETDGREHYGNGDDFIGAAGGRIR